MSGIRKSVAPREQPITADLRLVVQPFYTCQVWSNIGDELFFRLPIHIFPCHPYRKKPTLRLQSSKHLLVKFKVRLFADMVRCCGQDNTSPDTKHILSDWRALGGMNEKLRSKDLLKYTMSGGDGNQLHLLKGGNSSFCLTDIVHSHLSALRC